MSSPRQWECMELDSRCHNADLYCVSHTLPNFLCRLKCHNKCTKEAPSCRISFLPSKLCFNPQSTVDGHTVFYIYIVTFPISPPVAKIRRTESVPSDINNPVDRPPEAPQFGTLPKAITKKVQMLRCSALQCRVSLHCCTLNSNE